MSLKSGLPEPESEEGYLTDEWLDALRTHKFDWTTAALFLVHDLPSLTNHISSCLAGVKKARLAKRVEFHTGGWSGAEELIDTALSHFWVHHYHNKWQRGGHFYFEVPNRILRPLKPSGTTPSPTPSEP